MFSVALSLGFPRVAVSHRHALSCSDFPSAGSDWPATARPTHFSADCYEIIIAQVCFIFHARFGYCF